MLYGKWTGLLRDDSGALRGYSVALWQVGNKEKAVVMARKSMEVEMDAASIIGGQALLVKMIYSNSGCSPALAEMQTAPVEMFSDTKFCLSALAIAALSGNEKTLYSLINSCKDSLGHEGLIQAHLLAAASKQVLFLSILCAQFFIYGVWVQVKMRYSLFIVLEGCMILPPWRLKLSLAVWCGIWKCKMAASAAWSICWSDEASCAWAGTIPHAWDVHWPSRNLFFEGREI